MEKFHIINFCEIFSENAFCLSQRMRIPVDRHFTPRNGHTYIIFGAHTHAYDLLMMQNNMNNVRYIIINSEPSVSHFLRNKHYISLMKDNIVWDNYELSTNHLASMGIRVHSCYIFEFSYQPCERERDIDIMFIGTTTPRRHAIYELLVKTYPDKKIVFHFNFNMADNEGLTKELQRAKYFINIPKHLHNIYDTHSIHRALACGCSVVSLYSGNKTTDIFYEQYIHFCRDFNDFFDAPVQLVCQKLTYPNLIKETSCYLEHNLTVIKQLICIDKQK